MPKKSLPVKTIRQRVLLSASPEDVYASLTDPKKHMAFTGGRVTGKPRVGSKGTAHSGYISSKFIQLVPGKKIVQEWKTTEWPEGYPPSRLEYTLKSIPRGTELTMIQTKVPASQASHYRQGWKDHYWEPLKAYFAANRN